MTGVGSRSGRGGKKVAASHIDYDRKRTDMTGLKRVFVQSPQNVQLNVSDRLDSKID